MLHTPENRELHWNISSDCGQNYLIITTLLKYNKVYGLEVDEIKGYIYGVVIVSIGTPDWPYNYT